MTLHVPLPSIGKASTILSSFISASWLAAALPLPRPRITTRSVITTASQVAGSTAASKELLNLLEIKKERISIEMNDEVQVEAKNGDVTADDITVDNALSDNVPADNALSHDVPAVNVNENQDKDGAKMSKAEKKRLRRAQRKENEKEKKKKDKRERIIDHTEANGYDSISYVFENGLRKVKPYFYTYQTYVRGRWLDRNVLDVVSSEFRYDNEDNYATRLREGLICVNGSPVDASYILRNRDSLSSRVHRHEIPVAATPITVVHEDEDFLVVNKPSTIPVHPCGRFRFNTLTMIITREMGYKNVRTIHRLDRATSGVLILVKNFAKTQEMSERVKNRDLRKEYVCRVLGEFPLSAVEAAKTAEVKADSVSDVVDGENAIPSILVDAPLLCVSQKIGLNRVDSRGKESQTTFHRLSFNGVSSVVKCIPKTGRTHQIRVHLQYLGFPIMNDRFYNCPALWGPRNGAGGEYGGKNDEQLIEDAGKVHVVENYLEPDVYAELVRKHGGYKGEDENGEEEDKGERETLYDRPSSKKPKLEAEEKTKLIEEDSNGSGEVLKSDEVTCVGKKEVDESTEVNVCSNQDKDKSASPSSGATSSVSMTPDFDPTCKDCVQPTRDPTPKELVMFLHALRYSGPDFDFATPLPDWAQESWRDEEEWKLF